MNNREKLIDFISTYKLDRAEVAELVCSDRETVDRWLLSAESARHLQMPDMAIELLRLKLAEQRPSR